MNNRQVTFRETLATQIATKFNHPGSGFDVINELTQTVFKGANEAEITTLLVLSNSYRLNPFNKEICAFKAQGGGIVPVVTIDGWYRIVNDHPAYDGCEVDFDEHFTACTITMYRKDRGHPTRITEWMQECQRSNPKFRGPWDTHPRRMLRHRAFIQAARMSFGFGGVYTEEEAENGEAQPIIADNLKSANAPAKKEIAADIFAKYKENYINGTVTMEQLEKLPLSEDQKLELNNINIKQQEPAPVTQQAQQQSFIEEAEEIGFD